MGSRVVVTGGAGFLGSHLCRRLLALGNHVLCVDNFVTGTRDNIAGLSTNARFSLLEHDVTVAFEAEADEIYNFACPASPVHYQRDPVATLRTSVLGALNVLDLARRCGARVLQASTSEIYGDPEVTPQPESYRGNVATIGPRACYDEGKRSAETLFSDYRRCHGVDTRIVRIFNTYGPGMQADDGRVVSNFIVQALRGRPITIYGDGSQTRSFCHVDDLISGCLRMMAAPDGFAGPVNLGSPHEITIRELADAVIGLTGSRSTIDHAPRAVDDPSRRRPDITLATRVLGWQPTIGLEAGLRATIDYFSAIVRTGAARTAFAAGG